MRIVAASALQWKDRELFFGRKQVGSVVPDSKYPNMWRVEREDGSLTDMVNLSRAKDAAVTLALASLNNRQDAA
jgi:hypothetical protein